MSDVSLTLKQYEDMMLKTSKLEALEAGGVDNWEGYDFALREWNKENEVKELARDFVAFVNDLLVEADVDQPAGPGCGYSIAFDEEHLSNEFLAYCENYCAINGQNETHT